MLPIPVQRDGPGRVVTFPHGSHDFGPRDRLEQIGPIWASGRMHRRTSVSGLKGLPEVGTHIFKLAVSANVVGLSVRMVHRVARDTDA